METLYLDSFLKTLNEKINNNKKYDSFLKSIDFSVNNYKQFLTNLENGSNRFEQQNIKNILNANKDYATNNEKFNRSIEKLIEKNNSEVKKLKDENQKKHLKEKKVYQAKLENIKSIDTEKQEQEIKSIILEERRNTHKLEDEKIIIRVNYANEIKELETDYKNKKQSAITAHEVNSQILTQNFNNFTEKNKQSIETCKTKLSDKQQINDNIYLQIKTEYNEQSRAFNKKINEIKRKYQRSLPKITKLNEEKLLPLEENIKELELNLSIDIENEIKSFNDALINHDSEFKKLNLNYETKKAEIIKKYNDQMTLFNSKLSSYREENANNKLELEKTLRKDIKNTKDPRENERLSRKLTKELKQFDNDLNKEIIKTNNLLKENELLFQNIMLKNDSNYIKDKNNLESKHNLLIKNHEINKEKITKTYNTQIDIIKQDQKALELEENYYTNLLNNNERLELLPIEKQLTLSSYLQERELNSLANDAHEEILLMQKEIEINNLEFEKEEQILNANNTLEQTILDNSENKTNADLQLNQEKFKRIRDYKLEEQNLKQQVIELAKNIQRTSKEYEIKQINLNKVFQEDDLNNDFNIFVHNIQHENNTEQAKREHIIKDASLRNQLRLFLEKTHLNLMNHKFELNSNQIEMESLFSLFRNKLLFQNKVNEEIINLYNMPAHPEIFKAVLNSVINFLNEDETDLNIHFNNAKEQSKAFYLKKMDETTGYKFMTKHQTLIDKYDTLVKAETANKTTIQNEVIALENRRAILIGNKDRLISENNIRNNRENIRTLNRDILTIEREIANKQKDIIPIDNKINALNAQKLKEEQSLDKEKKKENIIFNNYIKKNTKIYNKLNTLFNLYFSKVRNFYHNLIDELYISKDLLEKEYKILSTSKYYLQVNLLKLQNNFLDHYLSFYNSMTKTLKTLDLNYINTIKQLLKNLENNYIISSNNLEKEYRDELNKKKLKKTNKELEYNNNIKALNNELAKITAQENDRIVTLENKIKNIVEHLNQDSLSLDDNIKQIESQYVKELNARTDAINNEIERIKREFNNKVDNITKNYSSQIESLKLRTQNILIKYNSQKQKLNETSEQKMQDIEKLIIYDKAKYDDRLKQIELKKQEINLQKEKAIKLLSEDYAFYESVLIRETNKKTKKDFSILKKSYRFKKRLLY